ncbi:hypothetical protein [Streptomyces sp. NPDC002763]|uniref:hypothetical protein n=1 Tax=Streptomyces sp. NPDC002763 TaxID=3154427 RepID=UPI00332180F7
MKFYVSVGSFCSRRQRRCFLFCGKKFIHGQRCVGDLGIAQDHRIVSLPTSGVRHGSEEDRESLLSRTDEETLEILERADAIELLLEIGLDFPSLVKDIIHGVDEKEPNATALVGQFRHNVSLTDCPQHRSAPLPQPLDHDL